MIRVPGPPRSASSGLQVYRSLTAPVLAAGAVAVTAIAAGPTILLMAEPWLVLAGFVSVAGLSSLAAGTLVRGFVAVTSASVALATSATVWALVAHVVEVRTGASYGEPLGVWAAPAASVFSFSLSLPAAVAGARLRRRIER